jgi:hypothetical protein
MPLPSLGLMEIDISPKPSARRAGEVQCLGDMPGYRATAIKPGGNHLMQKPGESQYRPTELTSVFWHLSGSLGSRGSLDVTRNLPVGIDRRRDSSMKSEERPSRILLATCVSFDLIS